MVSHTKFNCKLAHQSQIEEISGFNSIKELHERISQRFSISPNEILFCTLNTHDARNMDSILTNYLSMGDLIVIHLCGQRRRLDLLKSRERIGLTVTDNGHGRTFIKRVKSSDGLIEEQIKPGDHIAAINDVSVVGNRHYEVAKILRQIPLHSRFTLDIVEPIISQQPHKSNIVRPNSGSDAFSLANPVSYGQNESSETFSLDDLADSSLPIERLLSKTGAELANVTPKVSAIADQDVYKLMIKKIDTVLESFLGINDTSLAIQIYRLAKDSNSSLDRFSEAIENSELSVFKFDRDIQNHLWNCVNEAI